MCPWITLRADSRALSSWVLLPMTALVLGSFGGFSLPPDSDAWLAMGTKKPGRLKRPGLLDVTRDALLTKQAS